MYITYLDHSGFAVDLGDKMLIFDYYKGELPATAADRKLYIFASHAHQDHFQRCIFDWSKDHDAVYILSKDIRIGKGKGEELKEEGRIVRMGARQTQKVDDLEIETFRSTDEGVAFFVRTDGISLYHAGDLNWWHWEEESKAYNEMMKRNYQYEIGKLEGRAIDVAFVPLDPRQEEQYYWGMDYFMKHTDTKVVFPMHMWGQYEVIDWLMENPEAAGYIDRVERITKEQQEFEIGQGIGE